eukprot:577787-Prymnesium_polylepis.1
MVMSLGELAMPAIERLTFAERGNSGSISSQDQDAGFCDHRGASGSNWAAGRCSRARAAARPSSRSQ